MGAAKFTDRYDWLLVMERRAAGATWPEVAAELGVNVGALKMAYGRRRDALLLACEDLSLERAEIYSIAKAAMLRSVRGEGGEQEDRIIRAVPVLSRLLGLNAPSGVELRVEGGGAPAVKRDYGDESQ